MADIRTIVVAGSRISTRSAGKPMSATHFDIVMVSDFRLIGGTSSALAAEIRAFHESGLNIGLLQINSVFLDSSTPTHPEILECVRSRSAVWLQSEQTISCELLAVHNPIVFDQVKLPRYDISSRRRVLVAHHVPLAPTGSLNYDPWRLQAALRKGFGGEFIWAPVSPVCRQQFTKIAFDLPLLCDNWHSIIKAEEWGSPRSNPKFSNYIIGRHSRPGPEKWPETRRELLQSYPIDPDFEVRILGADSYLRGLLGSDVPENWQLLEFNEISPKEFLQGIDFFVYFHNPLILEAFGRAPAEAAAAGCVVILPPYLRETFHELAIYCEPQDVANVVEQYHADIEAYSRQSRLGYELVRERYGPESLVRIAKSAINGPRVVVPDKGNKASYLMDVSKRFCLRTDLYVRRFILSPLRSLLRPAVRALWPKA
jgi:hypothetical protein